jgi:hypothetical protein
VKANAAAYHLDVSKIAAIGESAGGFLVNYAGTHETPETRVAAVVDFDGPVDYGKLAELRRDHPERFNMATINRARQVADGIAFPNGMAVTPDNSTLIVAESYGKRLTAFDIAEGGSLSNRRVWAGLGDGVPDGICIDADNAVRYGDVPNKRCVRVREGVRCCESATLTGAVSLACSGARIAERCS